MEEDLTDIAMRSLVGDSEPNEEILEDEDIPDDDSHYDEIEEGDEEPDTIASVGGDQNDFVFQPVRRKH